MSAEVSHGRGGAGNISHDDTQYVDGEVVRTGAEGSHGDGAFSAGRGGAGNITDVGESNHERKDVDLVPDAAVRESQDGRTSFHTGRGGAGNEHKAETPEPKAQSQTSTGPHGLPTYMSVADKLKAKVTGVFKK